ncbi:MAG: thioesterase family protein [Alphaproteobacteria bacterium]|nr:thioesterase family protein [Alphaproteobacteria bacterium]
MSIPAPLELHAEPVLPEWIDYNGHMNVAYYVLAFDHATDAFLDYLGLDHDYKAKANVTTFVGDMNVTYIREVVEGDPMRFTTQLLEFDEKKFRYFHSMYHAEEGYLAATNELISLNIDLTSRRVGPMADVILQRLQAILDAHNRLPMPDGAGRVLGMRRG